MVCSGSPCSPGNISARSLSCMTDRRNPLEIADPTCFGDFAFLIFNALTTRIEPRVEPPPPRYKKGGGRAHREKKHHSRNIWHQLIRAMGKGLLDKTRRRSVFVGRRVLERVCLRAGSIRPRPIRTTCTSGRDQFAGRAATCHDQFARPIRSTCTGGRADLTCTCTTKFYLTCLTTFPTYSK